MAVVYGGVELRVVVFVVVVVVVVVAVAVVAKEREVSAVGGYRWWWGVVGTGKQKGLRPLAPVGRSCALADTPPWWW